MGGLSPARLIARRCVSERRRRSARMREVLRADAQMAKLSEAERALAFRLAIGATSAEALLDEIIDERLSRPARLEPRVRDALRVSCFEICYLSTASAVAVSQGVELVREVEPRAAGLANAVLRRVAEGPATDVRAARERCMMGDSSAHDIALAGGLTDALAEFLVSSCGIVRARDIALAQLEAAPVFASASPLAAEGLEAELEAVGLEPRLLSLAGALELGRGAGLSRMERVQSGELVVADLAAQLVACAATPAPGRVMLEVGQGRATKTLLIEGFAERLGAAAGIVGIDAVPSKATLAAERVGRAGWGEHVRCLAWDGMELAGPALPPELDRAFDVVFLDAPCTGTGTMRRHPEIPARLAECPEDAAAEAAGLQLALICQAAARVAEGGTLVYSTCSVISEECEGVVGAFLASEAGRGFEVEPVTAAPAACLAGNLLGEAQTSEGYLRTWPAAGGCDGHFCCRLVNA